MAATRSYRSNAEFAGGDRSTGVAAVPSYLHIQTDDDAPTRVLEMGAGPIRIGRGIQCEVRLNQVGLGDVQCTIRRRGDEWQVQPVGPPGRIWVDQRSTDQQRPLPVGVPLRVGRSTLTIHQANLDEQGRGSFDAPITVNAEPVEPPPPPAPVVAAPVVAAPVAVLPEPVVLAPEPAVDGETMPSSPEAELPPGEPTVVTASDDRVKRWQSRLDQRDQWLKDRQSEKRWEARWKAAGETIRARAGQPAPSSPVAPTSAAPAASTRPASPPATERVAPRPPIGRSAPVRTFAEPRPVFSHTPRGTDVTARAVPLRPEPAEPPLDRVEPAPVRAEPAPVVIPRTTRAVPLAVVSTVDWSPPPAPVTTLSPVAPEPSPPPVQPRATDFDDVESVLQAFSTPPEPAAPRSTAPVELLPDAGLPAPVLDNLAAARGEADRVTQAESAPAPNASPLIEARVPVLAPTEPPVSPLEEVVPPVPTVEAAPLVPEAAPPVTPAPLVRRPEPATRSPVGSEGAAVVPPVREGESARGPAVSRSPGTKDWPSARTIFDAQGTRATEAAAPAVAQRRQPRSIEPTAAVPPTGWTIPLPLGWLPTVGLVLLLGSGTVSLAIVWAVDSLVGNQGIKLATRGEGRSPLIDLETLPKATWWRTSAGSLAAWALALERGGKSAEARTFEADARSVSPLGARARFLQEPVAGSEADEMASIRLGPTRDIVTLAAMGHRLRREGKQADALRAYRSAFLIAATTARSTLGPPVFREDSPANRYFLPHATLLDGVARDMDDAGEWTTDEWADVAPEFGPARLAIANALRAKHPDEADRRLDAVCGAADQPLDSRFDAAEHRAAIAEALAERGRWTDSVAQYHLAIDGETRDLDRRVWWFNLAELAGKTGDKDARKDAIENAKGADLSDEVTQRAANAFRINPETSSLSAQIR